MGPEEDGVWEGVTSVHPQKHPFLLGELILEIVIAGDIQVSLKVGNPKGCQGRESLPRRAEYVM